MNFVIYTPHYDPESGGIMVLYKLYSLLNKHGHTAKIWNWTKIHSHENRIINGKISAGYFIPSTISKVDIECPYLINIAKEIDIQDSVVIYPEIIEGNPLRAKRVVRWLLNKPGAIMGTASYGLDELIIYYSEHFLPFGAKANHRHQLKLFEHREDLYKDIKPIKRSNCYFMVRKGGDTPLTYHPPGSIQVDGLRHRELAPLFQTAELFISYDLHTAYSAFASICGCDSVVVPRTGMTKEQWKSGKDVSEMNGIAYGLEDIQRARNTRPDLLHGFRQIETNNYSQVTNFLQLCQEYFNNK